MPALYSTYRPSEFEQVFGQDGAVRALESAIANHDAHVFLFSGASGVGKTTLAKIAANKLGCVNPGSILEIPAAVFTGVDDMRRIQSDLQYAPFGPSPQRALILDECHMLSRNAWDSLLKITEDTPKHVYWFFCTTQAEKVPRTIHTRALHLRLETLNNSDLTDLVEGVAAAEGITLEGTIYELIVREAGGSPRQALVNLAACRTVSTRAEAAQVLKTILEDNDVVFELCQFLANGRTGWAAAMQIVHRLDGAPPESARIRVMNYLSGCAEKAKTDDQATFFLQRMEAFERSYGMADAKSQLIRSIGRCMGYI